MLISNSQLNKFIIDSNLVSRTDFELALKEAEEKGEGIGEALVNSGKITEDSLRRMEAHVLGIPFVDLKSEKISFEILSTIPEPIARLHNIVAFKKNETSLEVALLDVKDISATDFLKKKGNLKILPRLTDAESIKEVILQYQRGLKSEFGDLIRKESANLKDGDLQGGNLVVDTLLKHAIVQNASNIHIEPLEEELLVRYRIDGILHDAMVVPKTAEPAITARIKTLASLNLDEKGLPQDGRFKVDMSGEKVSFRVSILPVHYGEKIVMRILRDNVSGFTLEQLGFHGEALERIHRALTATRGMILTTGPAGSGKTTTIYTMLDILNQPNANISTIEDPVECQMKRINQTQVNPAIGLTFASGLRSLMRQDSDIIMVGEVRDDETAVLTINASLAGRLVLSTLYTDKATRAVFRLIDMGIEPSLMASTIDIIIAQRLVRRLSDTKEKYFLSKSEIADLRQWVDLDRVLKALHEEKIVQTSSWEKIPFWKAVSGRNDDGYKGRVGIYEVLEMTPKIKEMISKGETSEFIEEQAKKEGMLTLIEDGIFKAVQGLTTVEEVLRK